MSGIGRWILPPEAFCLRKKFPKCIASALRTGVLLPPGDGLRQMIGSFGGTLLTVAILAICTVPLYAQSQPPNATELAQTVFGIIAGDKTKTQTYCQVLDLSNELDQVDQQKDRKKTEDLSQKINELQTKLGPEYLALLEATKYVDPNSKGGQEIVSIFDKLDSSCGD